jgi:hypothetical protein
MADFKLHSELAHLRKVQSDARWCEIFGGLSKEERLEYDQRRKRISVLQAAVNASAVADRASHSAKTAAADQRREWNKTSETDTHQVEARQSYRNREMDSANAFSDSSKTGHEKSSNSKDHQ